MIVVPFRKTIPSTLSTLSTLSAPSTVFWPEIEKEEKRNKISIEVLFSHEVKERQTRFISSRNSSSSSTTSPPPLRDFFIFPFLMPRIKFYTSLSFLVISYFLFTFQLGRKYSLPLQISLIFLWILQEHKQHQRHQNISWFDAILNYFFYLKLNDSLTSFNWIHH